MGLQLEEHRGDDDNARAHRDGGEKEEPAAAGYRTPRRAARDTGEGTVGACPPAPRKRRTTVASAPASSAVARRREFYAGADLEAFFAAHDL
ncbi:hypothetical protein D1007_04341 [Hordeum vulgare]|nr:hypothetical protein D1007_04341 [Hordeum vulgare]KAI5008212.1 hypothetical protein ZWY2020_009260 [Hordeum vulgare]